MFVSLLSRFLLIISCAHSIEIHSLVTQSFCLADMVHIRCRRHEVIVTKSARFGRMRIGKCAAANFGYIGCYKDVLSQVDHLCSGRQACSFPVAERSILQTQPCPQDVTPYLNLTYSCMPAESHECGTMKAPWIIQAKSGQKLNISLLDFGPRRGGDINSTNHHLLPNSYCREIAVVRESGGRRATICSGNKRQQMAYFSRSHRVEVEITAHKTRKSTSRGHFILVWQAIGCANYEAPSHSWVERIGDEVKVSCNNSAKIFTLTCIEGSWIGTSMLIIIGVALVVVVYIAVTVVCITYIRSKRAKTKNRRCSNVAATVERNTEHRLYQQVRVEEKAPMLTVEGNIDLCELRPVCSGRCAGDYTNVCELQLINNCTAANPCAVGNRTAAAASATLPRRTFPNTPIYDRTNGRPLSFSTFKPGEDEEEVDVKQLELVAQNEHTNAINERLEDTKNTLPATLVSSSSTAKRAAAVPSQNFAENLAVTGAAVEAKRPDLIVNSFANKGKKTTTIT